MSALLHANSDDEAASLSEDSLPDLEDVETVPRLDEAVFCQYRHTFGSCVHPAEAVRRRAIIPYEDLRDANENGNVIAPATPDLRPTT